MSQFRRVGRPRQHVAEQAGPVFVDQTGRRRRVAVLAGICLGAGFLVGLTLIVMGLFVGSATPLPDWPDGGRLPRDPVAERPEPSPTPDRREARPTPTGGQARESAAPIPAGTPATTAPPSARESDRPGRDGNPRTNPPASPPRGKPSEPPGKGR